MSDAEPTFGALVANWNGEAFIERCLSGVLAARRRAGIEMPVLVTDDASTDRSPAMIAQQFPGVRLLAWTDNAGFGEAVNRGMAALECDWVFLLNNDLALKADYFERLLATWRAADREKLFAIGAQTLDWDTQAPNHAGQRAQWVKGLPRQTPFQSDDVSPTVFFQAGACLINRKKFLALGGFAALYKPGYWEDYDLAWQAQKQGWVNLYDPRAVAYHCGKGSMRRALGDWGVSLTMRRNHLLFTWANLSDGGLLARHLFGLGRVILNDDAAPGQAGWGRALLAALGKLPEALRLRRARTRGIVTDRAIMQTGAGR